MLKKRILIGASKTPEETVLDQLRVTLAPLDVSDVHFRRDSIDTFQLKKAGIMFPHVLTGKALNIWTAFNESAKGVTPVDDQNYYPFSDGAFLVRTNKDYFGSLVREKKCNDMPFIVVEAGTGSIAAIREKTIPFLEAVVQAAGDQKVFYVALDRSGESAMQAATMIKEKFPNIKTHSQWDIDFNVDDIDIPWKGRKFWIEFGATSGNVAGFRNAAMPRAGFEQPLTNFHRHLDEGDVLIRDWDHTTNPVRINKAYKDRPEVRAMAGAIVERVGTELSGDFPADNYEFFCEYIEQSRLNAVGFVAKEEALWQVGNEWIHQRQGDFVGLFNSYKPLPEETESFYKNTRWQPLGRIVGPQQGIHFYIDTPILRK